MNLNYYENMEPESLEDERRSRIKFLRWEMECDPSDSYTLEELEDMYEEKNGK